MNEQQERKNRLKMVVDWMIENRIAATKRSLARMLGYNPCTLSQILTGSSSVSERFVDNLCEVDSRINGNWILTGAGEMIHGGEPDCSEKNIDETISSICGTDEDVKKKCSLSNDRCVLLSIMNNQATVLTRMGGLLEYLVTKSRAQDRRIEELTSQLEKLRKKQEKDKL